MREEIWKHSVQFGVPIGAWCQKLHPARSLTFLRLKIHHLAPVLDETFIERAVIFTHCNILRQHGLGNNIE